MVLSSYYNSVLLTEVRQSLHLTSNTTYTFEGIIFKLFIFYWSSVLLPNSSADACFTECAALERQPLNHLHWGSAPSFLPSRFHCHQALYRLRLYWTWGPPLKRYTHIWETFGFLLWMMTVCCPSLPVWRPAMFHGLQALHLALLWGATVGWNAQIWKTQEMTFLDEDIELKHPKLLFASSPPADKVACSSQSQKVFLSYPKISNAVGKKYQDLYMIAFSFLD